MVLSTNQLVIREKKQYCLLRTIRPEIILLFFILISGLQLKAQPVFSTAATQNRPENPASKLVVTITTTSANPPVTYAIISGRDSGKFTLNSNTGELNFRNFPNYETPGAWLASNTYYLTVRATDAAGFTDRNFTINVTNVNENPDPPRNLYIISQDRSNVLRWTASVVTTGITQYRIYRSEDSLSWNLINSVPVGTATYTDNNLVNGKFYFYAIRSWNGVTESGNSNIDASSPNLANIYQYLHFDGNGDYLVASDSLKLMAQPFLGGTTLECWVRFSSLPSGRAYIVSRDYNIIPQPPRPAITNGSSNLKWYSIYYDSNADGLGNARIVFEYNVDGSATYQRKVMSTFAPVPNKWYHIAGTYRYSNAPVFYPIRLYVNGHSQNYVAGTNGNVFELFNYDYPADSRLVIGATTATVSPLSYSNYLDGDVTEVRYWNMELDSTTIQNNMYTRRRGDEANLLGLWHLDTLLNRKVYNYDNNGFNALIKGDVCAINPRKEAVDDNASCLASSPVFIDVRKNDHLFLPSGTSKSVVLTKIIKYPSHGTASVINRDSIQYHPDCFLGKDTIVYLICDTTFFSNPYIFSDTTKIIINTYDNLKPSINCTVSANQSVLADVGYCYYTMNTAVWDASATDNCTVTSITYRLEGVTTGTGTTLNNVKFNKGLTTVWWRASDAANNMDSCSFTVTVSDNQKPQLTCTTNKTVNTSAGVCTYTNNATTWDASATDNCSVTSLTYRLEGVTTGTGTTLNSVTFNKGLTRVWWRAVDAAGNMDSCSFTVTVSDYQKPQLSCPINKTVNTLAGVCTYTHNAADWDASATDNCAVTSLTYRLEGVTTGTGTTLNTVTFNKGLTTIWWRAVDAANNVDSCSFTVTVTDNQKPVLSCNPDKTINTGVASCIFTYNGVGWNASATDNCAVTSLYYRLEGVTTGTGTSLNGTVFNLGTTIVWWIASDADGNKDSCRFTVLIWDNHKPSVSCGTDKTVYTDTNSCKYIHSNNLWDANASDNCSLAALTFRLEGATTGTGTSLNGVSFNKGITRVWWRALDGTGNSDSCSYTVTLLDNQKPSIYCIGNTSVSTDIDTDTYTHISSSWDATGNDNCGSVSLAYRLEGVTSGFGATLNNAVFKRGITVVWWIAADTDGNKDSTNYTITVNDSQLPSISCTSDKTVNTDSAVCSYACKNTDWDATGSDNVPGWSITYNLSGATSGSGISLNGVSFNQGQTLVTWTNTDINNNTVQCSFSVIVNDNQNPLITSPSDINVYSDFGTCSASIVSLGTPIISDNCGIASLTNNAPAIFLTDTTIVVWTATDLYGNAASATQRVIVSDDQNPQISAPPDIVTKVDPGTHAASGVILGQPATSDNCGIESVTNDAPVLFPSGITIVRWTVTDIHGNYSTANQTVTVSDNQPPVITSPSMVSVLENNTQVMTITVADPDINDNSWVFSITGGMDASRFQINPFNGNLIYIAAPDFESPSDMNLDNVYEVGIIVSDAGGLTDTLMLFISVLNANETPVDIILSKSNVSEHQPIGTLIGILRTIDTDIQDSHSYTLSGPDADQFIIDADILKTGQVFDYSAKSVYNLTIRTIDLEGAYYEKSFVIAVDNINEPPVITDNTSVDSDTLNFAAFSDETANICIYITDPDNDQTSITTLTALTGESKISFEDGSSCFDYIPSPGFFGTEILFSKVHDSGSPVLYDSVIIIINVQPRFIFSQVISPNNDNINDYWTIGGLERFSSNKVTVFNRWGDIVYKANGYDNVNIVWKGEIYNGTKLTDRVAPDGTYFYIIDLGNGSKITGFLVLKR